MKLIIRFSLLIALVHVALHCHGQKPKDIDIDKIKIPEVVGNIEKLLLDRYLFPDSAQKMSSFLQNQLANNAYENVKTASELANKLTSDFQKNFFDKHLRVTYAPRLVRMLNNSSPEDQPSQAEIEELLAVEVFENFRIPEVKRLSGNLGYLRIDQFLPPQHARGYKEKLAACFELLADTEALIIDLRENPGGYGDGVGYFLSLLLPEKTKIFDEISRVPSGGMQVQEGGTVKPINTRQYLEKPVYVLTSSKTASAAEAVSHVLKYSGRAQIIGQSTYGAGYLGDDFVVDDSFVMTISYATGKHPAAERGWEGDGVQPHVLTDYHKAFHIARTMALSELVKAEEAKRKKDRNMFKLARWKWEIERLEALQKAEHLTAEMTREYTGSYESRVIELRDGHLYYGRTSPHSTFRKLIPVGKDEFLVEGLENYRMTFLRNNDGSIASLKLYSIDRLIINNKTD